MPRREKLDKSKLHRIKAILIPSTEIVRGKLEGFVRKIKARKNVREQDKVWTLNNGECLRERYLILKITRSYCKRDTYDAKILTNYGRIEVSCVSTGASH